MRFTSYDLMGTQDSLSSDVLQTGKVPVLGPLLLLA